jgi:TRAP-type mannitol/chloroaromatic compound transport system permease large subunit
MTDPQLGVLMLSLFIGAIFLGFPIAFTMMALGVIFGLLSLKTGDSANIVWNFVVENTFRVMANDVLIAIPLFIFMGYIIERANILDRLFHSLQLAMSWLPGALAVATLATCALFATATGIVGAVVTLMGLLAYPAMLRAGYDSKLSAGVVCAGGCLGILIPPSVMLILYGATAGVPVPRLYAGALIPGIMLAGLYMLYVIVRTAMQPSLAPKLPPEQRERLGARSAAEAGFAVVAGAVAAVGTMAIAVLLALASPDFTWDQALTGRTPLTVAGAFGGLTLLLFLMMGRKVGMALVTSFFPLAVLIMAVLGAIVFGWALPAQAAALGAVGAVLIAILYRSFSWVKLKESVYLTARTSAMVCWLFVGSAIFAAVFAKLGGQQVINDFVLSLGLDSLTFMLLTQAIIFLLGWPLEWTEIIVIFVPIFLPLLKDFGIDPLFFGIMVALNLQTSFLSPPVAMAPFYLKGVAPKHVTINEIFRGVYPFLAIVVVAMALLYVFPNLATWLPQITYGR